MNKEQIDRLISAYENFDIEEVCSFVKDDNLRTVEDRSNSNRNELILKDLMSQIKENQEGYAYFISQAQSHSCVFDYLIASPDKEVIRYCLINMQLEPNVKLLLIKSVGQGFIKEVLEAKETVERLKTSEIVELIKTIEDKEYIKKVIEGKIIVENLKNSEIIDLIRKIEDKEYIKKIIEGNIVLEILDNNDKFELIKIVGESEFYKKIIKENIINLSLDSKLELMEEIDDTEFIKKCFASGELGLPTDNVEFLIRVFENFGKLGFNNFEEDLFSKEAIESLGEENIYKLIKYYKVSGKNVELGKVLEKPEEFEKYNDFRKNVFLQKQMEIMGTYDAIHEFNDNFELISECIDSELSKEEEKLFKSVLKEKGITIKSKNELNEFPQIRQKYISQMINSDSKEAVIYLLTGMNSSEYEEKVRKYLSEEQLKTAISDFNEESQEFQIIMTANDMIQYLLECPEEERIEKLNIINNELSNEFAERGSKIAKVRGAFEDSEILLRKLYGKELSSELKSSKNNMPDPVKDEENGIEIIKLEGQDFKLLVHGIDAFGKGARVFGKKEVGKTYICTSLISNTQLKRATAKCYYGFSDIDTNALIIEGPHDISSYAEDNSLEVVSRLKNSEYCLTDDLINKSNKEGKYNEIAVWREYIGDNGENKEIKPNYIVCFSNRGISERDKKEAKRLRIPIVLIDEKKYLGNKKEETSKSPKMKEELHKERDILKIWDILKTADSKASIHVKQEAIREIVDEYTKEQTQEINYEH